jgi:hypothetical protein
MSPATPLAGDVPPQHLMCPVHSADGRRQGHPAGGVPVHSVGRQYARAVAYTMLIITRSSAGYQYRMHYGHYGARRSSGRHWHWVLLYYSLCFAPGPACQGSAPLYVPPFSYKRGGTQREANLDSSSLRHTYGVIGCRMSPTWLGPQIQAHGSLVAVVQGGRDWLPNEQNQAQPSS